MKNLTLSLGILLTILGLATYLGTGQSSITALIPSFFGVIFIVLGILSNKDNLRKHALNFAVVLAVLGAAGTATGAWEAINMIGDADATMRVSVYGRTAMFLMCLVYVFRTPLSFIEKRKNKEN